ncbi:hypothetical protein HMI55_002786 [Coelomomyces lativittatus]|nr:hypothetical protein HMI55_002786 [Coelomomyces lativittatus]
MLIGYTGYIPRSREHFGKSYNVTTSASLGDFETLYAAKDQLPEKVQKITQGKPVRVYPHLTQQDHVSAVMAKSKRAAELQAQCSTTSFISGYTGFVPQMRNQFGEQYQKSAVLAMQAWKTKQVMNEHYLSDFNQKIPVIYSPSSSSSSSSSFPASNALKNEKKKLPIPGYTGFIPLSKYAYAHTYGHSLQALKTNRPVTDDPHNPPLRKKDLAVTLPIPGYKGFLPFYQMCGEKSFGQTSKKCIQEFKTLMNSRVHEI